jgi:2,4-dienoyl-CoA reductase-like NADH-dependent reductase (Old Yellow Enzyme family)
MYAIYLGFDGVEILAALYFLPGAFLTAKTNERTDEYGGESLESRSRFIFDVYENIKLV